MTRLRTALIAVLLIPCLTGQDRARAQGLSAETLFADAAAKERAVRKVLEDDAPPATLLKAVRTVVADYENVVRRYPASGYSDDALWRGAILSRDALTQFHERREATTAVRLLQALTSQYPSSKFAKLTAAEIALIGKVPVTTPAATPAPAAITVPPPGAPATATAPAMPAPSPPPSLAPVSTAAATPAAAPTVATIKDIRRAVLQDVIRIVIELDKEVTFHDERIENPSRVFVDLPATRAIPALVDQTVRFESDADPVRQVRLGRHPNQMTRVVLDTAGISSYSVYPLYAPFRLVIDCLRSTPSKATLTRSQPPAIAPAAPLASATPRPPAAPTLAPSTAAGSQPVATSSAKPLPARGVNAASVAVPLVTPKAIIVPPLTSRAFARQRIRVPAVKPLARANLDAAAVAAQANAVPLVDTAAAVNEAAPAIATAPAPTEAARNLGGGFSIARQLGLSVSRIVIDPGHGGHDPGTKGAGSTEADIVLDIAQRLEVMLQKVPGVEVVLTRRTDEFVSLQERTAIANRENADLFLSIHANANNSPSASGVETYFLNFASNLSAAAVAARENAASGQTMASLPDVVRTIALNNKLDESRDFATYVQREMIRSLRPANKTVKDLGVKQAPFAVLIGAAMPSVLAEISFLTNAQEARLLKGNAYRQRIATALFDAVRKYQASLKTVPGQGPTASSR